MSGQAQWFNDSVADKAIAPWPRVKLRGQLGCYSLRRTIAFINGWLGKNNSGSSSRSHARLGGFGNDGK